MTEASAAAPKRVLVVDDEEDVRSLVRRVLLDAGYAVEEAEEGSQAIRRIAQDPPDLIVLDLMMPGVDGWGVLRHLRGLASPPPVVIVTARGDDEAFSEVVRAGAAAFVAKPFHFADLLSTIRMALARPAPEPPQDERRRLPRRDLMVKVRVLSKERSPVALGELVNISPGGAQVNLIVPLDPGTRVRVALHISAADVGLKFEGRVQWRSAEAEGFAHGLEFVDLDDAMRQRLLSLLEPNE